MLVPSTQRCSQTKYVKLTSQKQLSVILFRLTECEQSISNSHCSLYDLQVTTRDGKAIGKRYSSREGSGTPNTIRRFKLFTGSVIKVFVQTCYSIVTTCNVVTCHMISWKSAYGKRDSRQNPSFLHLFRNTHTCFVVLVAFLFCFLLGSLPCWKLSRID